MKPFDDEEIELFTRFYWTDVWLCVIVGIVATWLILEIIGVDNILTWIANS